MCLKMFSSNENNTGTVPAFLSKLWMLVEDRTYDDLISWGMNGRSFHVHDQVRFAKEILPLYFKHNNIASFIRQLNMYGFRKVVNLEQGALKTEKDNLEFQHNYFVRGQEKLLEMIKRKRGQDKLLEMIKTNVPNVKLDAAKLSPEDFGKLLSDVKVWKTKQNHINLKLETMKRQNDALWREVASLRQKHKQQQQIVNKLIQLLITFVQHNRSLTNMKRQLPRMIEEAPETQEAAVVVPSKRGRFSKQLSIEENSDQNSQQLVIQGDILDDPTESPSTAVTTPAYSPVIQDIQDVMLSKTNTGHCPTIVEISDDDAEHRAKINRFQLDEVDASRLLNEDVVLSSSTGESNDSPASTEPIGQDLILASPESEREALAEQLNSIQVDLDDLQGMLSDSSGSYNLDTNSLLSFFGQDTTPSSQTGGWQDSLFNGLEEEQQAKSSNVTGCELIQYTPADLSCWLDETPSVESDEDDILNTQLNTPDCSLDKEVELPSSTGKRKSKRPMRILLS